jgi:methylated-DNA-[protein]-cysteine S-methyltransferase
MCAQQATLTTPGPRPPAPDPQLAEHGPPEVTAIHWAEQATALGPVFVAASPDGVLAVGTGDHTAADFVERLEAELGVRARPVAAPSPLLDQALAELREYFAGQRQSFSVPLDWRLLRGSKFYGQALQALAKVPWGTLVSYSELARRAGAPRAARAVGSACAHNPLPILVPCHRVIHADGTLGGYGGGARATDYKRALLALEGVVFPVGR